MNILPKKKWHVRTKENIERVRRDEAKAAEEEKELERRRLLAEQEARTALLRDRARRKMVQSGVAPKEVEESIPEVVNTSVVGKSGHINFFQDLENGDGMATSNKEHEEEKKKEQEEYEKKVGYLTYLGQDTEELTGEQVWWRKLPKDRLAESANQSNIKSAVAEKQKQFMDPLADIKKYLKCDGVRLTYRKYEEELKDREHKAINFESMRKEKEKEKKRKRKRSSSGSSSSEGHSSNHRSKKKSKMSKKLKKKTVKKEKSKKRDGRKRGKDEKKKSKKRRRVSSSSEESEDGAKSAAKANLDKLRRERLEREKVERAKADRLMFGEPQQEEKGKEAGEAGLKTKQKYNSQFNPDIAKQNKLDSKTMYWLQ